MMGTLSDQLELLHQFSACDVSDALVKLQEPGPDGLKRGGFLADLVPFAPKSPLKGSLEEQPKVIAPASTLQFVSRTAASDAFPSEGDPTAIPQDQHWVDLTEEGTVLVVDQPLEQRCAAIGGIMAARMKVRGVKAAVVSGRVRDLEELRESNLPIWARAKSTVGTAAEAKVRARNVVVSVRGVTITPGDIIFCDPLEGIVAIPKDLLGDVLELMPRLVEADDRIKNDVNAGMSVFAAFKKHRT